MPPTTTPAHMPDLHARAMLGFALALQQQDPSFCAGPPMRLANGSAVRIGSWAIGLDLNGPADRHFGRYANCSPVSRCLNCSPFCTTETPAVDLSIRSGGCSALWVEAEDLFDRRPCVSVRSFVPGRPESSDVWVPTLCPVTGRLQLVATIGMRTALLMPDGTFMMGTGTSPADRKPMAFMMFVRWWKSLMPAFLEQGGTDLRPVAVATGRAW